MRNVNKIGLRAPWNFKCIAIAFVPLCTVNLCRNTYIYTLTYIYMFNQVYWLMHPSFEFYIKHNSLPKTTPRVVEFVGALWKIDNWPNKTKVVHLLADHACNTKQTYYLWVVCQTFYVDPKLKSKNYI